ncbi:MULTISPECIES: glutathione S-transferase family protein [unclassified Methylibium]|uniref:glutathione S-transferase family protein n=1 Tax=unclassified Methylibium TaxID=2633235 RepID=UPI0006FAF69E|nr:glutathione S-transferase family protein [Methylibium sp. Root1272]KQW76636.1 glutathione S-transferase [Methylibium sp. Root1272]
MSDLILHHYPASPFAEKTRLMLGYKRLAWRSVTIPIMMPKPNLVALTGGYRKTPVLQVGADVYCDTALIARVIEARAPEPTLYPAESAGVAPLIAQWADFTLFWTAVPYTLQPAGMAAIFAGAPPEVLNAFGADRAAMTSGLHWPAVSDATAQLHNHLGWIEQRLADGRAFLGGGTPSIADFSVAHCVWFVKSAPPVVGILDAYPKLLAWHARVLAFGHGRPEALGEDEALAIAAGAKAHAPVSVEPGLGFESGERVAVSAVDYGRDPVVGPLVGLTRESVTVERRDDRAGRLHVHFPRLGFQIKKDATA